MNKEQFWSMIDKARSSTKSTDEMYDYLYNTLVKMPLDEIESFYHYQHAYEGAGYKERLIQAANLTIGCTDDGFIDFRRWVIAQGKNAYLDILKNPDNISKLGFIGKENFMSIPYFETLGYVADYAYENQSGGKELDYHIPQNIVDKIMEDITYHTLIDIAVDKDNIIKAFPNLSEVFMAKDDLEQCVNDYHQSKVFTLLTYEKGELCFPVTTEQRLYEEGREPKGSSVTIKVFSPLDVATFVSPLVNKSISIAEVNVLAHRLNELSKEDLDKLQTVVKFENRENIKDVINASFNLKRYEIYHDCTTYEDVGGCFMHNYKDALPELIFRNIDLEGLGEDVHKNFGGEFIGENFIMETGNDEYIKPCNDENVEQMALEYEEESQSMLDKMQNIGQEEFTMRM